MVLARVISTSPILQVINTISLEPRALSLREIFSIYLVATFGSPEQAHGNFDVVVFRTYT